MDLFVLIAEELRQLNLFDESIEILKKIVNDYEKHKIIDLFHSIILVMQTNHKIRDVIDFQNCTEIIIHFILHIADSHFIIIEPSMIQELNFLVSRLGSILYCDVLHENLEKHRRRRLLCKTH